MPFSADEETVRALRATIDENRTGGSEARAMQALEGLAAIRNDRSLLHIHSISVKARGRLKKRAAQILGDVCRQRGLSQDELEDRIVPELGLDERGTMTLDYGARKFTVGFDELLQPFVRDDGGNRLAGIPHVGKGDDAAMAERAAESWKILKSEVRSIGNEQAQRLERAMCAERHWTAESFATHLVGHRLLGHLARRLIYGRLRGNEIEATFRVAEDGTYADASDATLPVALGARIVIVHPAKLDSAVRTRWQEVLGDYEVVQPFEQLERALVTLTDEEMHGTITKRFAGAHVRGGAFFGLRSRGWEHDWSGPIKRIGPGLRAQLEVSPGIESFARTPEDQTLGNLQVYGKTFSALSPVVRSELLRDVELLRFSESMTGK